jgi:predicted dehydrogenase
MAVVGVGEVARRHYLPEISRLGGKAEITIVCGRQAERAQRVAEEFDIPRWTTDVAEAVGSDVDAVVNLTPHHAHRDITRAALQMGRHVYTEKPLAMTPADARELRDGAVRRGLVLVCAPPVMLFPQVTYVRQLLNSGDLGAIRSFRAQAIGGIPPWSGYESDPSPYFGPDAGPLVDIGVYQLHALTGLLGPAESVLAMSRRTRENFVIGDGPLREKVVPVQCEDHWQLLVALPGCIGSVEASFATVESAAPECELRGDAGAVAFSLLGSASPLRVLRPGTGWTDVMVAHERESGADLMLGMLHLVDCISKGRPALASADHAIHVLDILAAARRSAALGKSIEIGIAGQRDPRRLTARRRD